MSTIRLLKDHAKGKKGELVSAPFLMAREMVERREAEFPPQEGPQTVDKVPAPEPPAERHQAEIARLNEAHAQALAELRTGHSNTMKDQDTRHREELAKIKAQLDAAQKTITELHQKLKK